MSHYFHKQYIISFNNKLLYLAVSLDECVRLFLGKQNLLLNLDTEPIVDQSKNYTKSSLTNHWVYWNSFQGYEWGVLQEMGWHKDSYIIGKRSPTWKVASLEFSVHFAGRDSVVSSGRVSSQQEGDAITLTSLKLSQLCTLCLLSEHHESLLSCG